MNCPALSYIPTRRIYYLLLTIVMECFIFLQMFLFQRNVFKTIIAPINGGLAVLDEFWHMMIPLTQIFGELFLSVFCICLLFAGFQQMEISLSPLLLLIFNFIALWSQDIVCMTLTLWNKLDLFQWPRTWPILINICYMVTTHAVYVLHMKYGMYLFFQAY